MQSSSCTQVDEENVCASEDCTNGATNYPACDQCDIGFHMNNGICVEDSTQSTSESWVIGCYPSWNAVNDFPPNQVDYTTYTHIDLFTMYPNSDGTLDPEHGMTDSVMRDAVSAAHSNGRVIYYDVGGSPDEANIAFGEATKDANRDRFVQEMVDMMIQYDFDGISLDWEHTIINDQYYDLVVDLRAAMDNFEPNKLLMMDIANYDRVDHYNQIKRLSPYVDYLT